MAYNDIQRLRQQQIFQPQDMSGMGEDYGMGMGGMGIDYAPSYLPPRSQGMLDQIGQQPATTGPRTPDQGVISSEMPSPSQVSAGTSNASTQPSSGKLLDEILAAMNKVYTPNNVASDRLNKLMNEVPERNNPSWARKMVAGGMGLDARQRRGTPGQELTATASPVETMEKVMYAPYLRDMQSWTAKADPYIKTADLENRANINERTLAGNVATSAWQMDKTQQATRIAEERNRIAEEKNKRDNEARMIIARAQALKAQKWDIRTEGDQVVAYSPDDPPRRMTLGDSGMMDQRDLEILKGEWREKAATAAGAAAINRIEAGGTGVFQDRDGKQWRFDPATNGWVPVTGPVGGPGPTGPLSKPTSGPGVGTRTNSMEANRIINDKLEQTYQTDPVNKQYVKVLGQGKYDFKPRPVLGETVGAILGMGGKKITEQDINNYDDFRKEIDPSYTPPKSGGIGPSGTGKQSTAPVNPRIGPTPGVGTGPGGFVAPKGNPIYGPEVPNKFKPKQPGQIGGPVTAGEVAVRDKKTGREFAVRKEKLQEALATGLYEQVK